MSLLGDQVEIIWSANYLIHQCSLSRIIIISISSIKLSSHFLVHCYHNQFYFWLLLHFISNLLNCLSILNHFIICHHLRLRCWYSISIYYYLIQSLSWVSKCLYCRIHYLLQIRTEFLSTLKVCRLCYVSAEICIIRRYKC